MSNTALERLFAAMQSSKGFPTLERTAVSVLGSLNSGLKSNHEVAAHIMEDFSLTQKLLKLANSAMYAPFASGISSITSALDVLGSDALLHLVLSTALITDDELQDDENLSKSLLAAEFARNACGDQAEAASIATLMYDLGRLVTTKYLPDEMTSIDKKVAAGVSAHNAELEVLDITLQDIGIALAQGWNLPASILATIDGTGDATLVGLARFSTAASSLVHAGKTEAAEQLFSALDLPGIDKSKLGAVLTRRAADIQARPKPPAAPVTEYSLTELYEALSRDPSPSVEDLAHNVFPAFSRHLKTTHSLLFMRSRSGEFRVRNGYGKKVDMLKNTLRLSAEFKPTAFHAVIQNNVDVSIENVARLKPASLPDGYRECLPHVKRFIILPIATQRVTGLLYCDWETDRVLSPGELEEVKKLRNLFLPFFS